MGVEAKPNPVKFGRFQFDFIQGRLQKNGLRLKLAAQPTQILAMLLGRAGELVTREELRARLWGEAQFSDSEHNLNVALAKLREVLGDSAEDPRFIATVPRQGYRFICPVAPVEELVEEPLAAEAPTPASPLAVPVLPASAPLRMRLRWLVAAIAVAAAGLGGMIAYKAIHPNPSSASGRVRLAVLPFENLSRDAEQEYFSDGLTEEMISRLGKIRPGRLSVIARSSVMRYKKGNRSAKDVGRELGVDYILEGSVRRDGDHTRITAKLIQVRDETQLWADTYDRDVLDWIGIQTEVALRVGGDIEETLNSKAPAEVGRPLNASAHEEYLRGRYEWNKRNKPGLTKAIGHFQRAIEIDPLYASAYAGLADSYLLMSNYAPIEETFPKVEAAARKALQIDPLLAEAHTSLGLSAMNYRWSWEESEREYKRAIEIDPNYATAHHWYAENLNARGRFDEALGEIGRARELDPLSLIIASDTGKILCYARRYPEAIDRLRRVLAEDSNFGEAHYYLVQAYMNSGLLNEALADLDSYQDPDRMEGWFQDLRASVLAKMGRLAEARRIVSGMEQAAVKAGRRTFAFRSYVALGEPEKLFAALQENFEHRSVPTNLKVDPVLDPLRGDARFTAALKKMGL